ncbi:hypothetical protein DERF_013380 [Dermatophagoides farinae]|uniref:Uncharacterized protein n=1 Tax=Dermatophagoides farinae TaxID=6954 RepID=A0A922L293_DERFA|nr:hypothetical protein DERF_013380 [Dermatophagoides farinae]
MFLNNVFEPDMGIMFVDNLRCYNSNDNENIMSYERIRSDTELDKSCVLDVNGIIVVKIKNRSNYSAIF